MQPDTIPDKPIPLLGGSFTDPSGSTTSDSSSQGQTPEPLTNKPVPLPVVAVDVLSDSLDTQTRRIKSSYSFEENGAIKIGDFKQGIHGEIDISPDGIVATNKSGETTVSIDGTTGDATFKGTVQTGSVVSGSVVVGGAGNDKGTISVLDGSNQEKVLIDKDGITIQDGKLTLQDATNTTIIDSTGLVSTANFDSSTTTQTAEQDVTTKDTWVDLTGASISTTVARDTKTLILLTVYFVINSSDLSSDFLASAAFAVTIDGTQADGVINFSATTNGGVQNLAAQRLTGSTHVMATLGSGVHTIKAQAFLHKFSGHDPEIFIRGSTLSFIKLGT